MNKRTNNQSWTLHILNVKKKDHYSTVTLKFEQSSDHTIIHLTQEGIPMGEVETVRRNWQNYYWNSIKSVFGYGIPLKNNSSESFHKKRNNSSGRKKYSSNSGSSDGGGGGGGSSSNSKKKRKKKKKKNDYSDGGGIWG